MTNSPTLVNDTRLADTNKLIKKLGAESAHSALAKPKMALAIAQARADGVIGDDDGASTYDTYLEGRRSVLAKSSLGAGAEDGGSYKANVSKNTQIIKAAGLITAGVDFVDVLTRATAIRETLVAASEKVWPTFDTYVKCAREQLKQADTALTDEQITEAARKHEQAEKDLVAKLVDDYKRMYKRAEEFPCDALAQAVASIGEAINEAGGEVPPMTKEEKQEAAAMAFIASRGFSLVKSAPTPMVVPEVTA